jgi:hypothetical protein
MRALKNNSSCEGSINSERYEYLGKSIHHHKTVPLNLNWTRWACITCKKEFGK